MDAITTAYLWYLGPERDDTMFAAYAATYPDDVHQGLLIFRNEGLQALCSYVETTL